MYWPIGAPRIYAASSSKASKDRVHESDDDAESRETTEGSGSLLNAPSIDSGGQDGYGERRLSISTTPLTPTTPGIKPVEHDTQELASTRFIGQDGSGPAFGSTQADKEPLLALRISRTGHLLAVITSTTLTIWQTKVRNFLYKARPKTLIICVANCYPSCSDTIPEVLEQLRSERIITRPTGLGDFRCPNYPWLPDYIHFSYRSRCARL
jgi:hypothetical protein